MTAQTTRQVFELVEPRLSNPALSSEWHVAGSALTPATVRLAAQFLTGPNISRSRGGGSAYSKTRGESIFPVCLGVKFQF